MLAVMRIVLATLHSKYIHASLALPYLAAYCGDLACDFEIREFTVHEPQENVLELLLASSPDVIALSVYLWNRRETLELVDALAIAAPQVRIVLGGPEVSFEGTALLHAHPGICALVRGEGELPLHGLLSAWLRHQQPDGVPRLTWREGKQITEGPDAPPLEDLDAIPSPFAAELVDLSRGFTYLETSRGCPYRCSFCMSALDDSVRSFSMQRIRSDLRQLMDARVAKIKLVDRTFNYSPARAREIFSFILEHNRNSHFHFEIGAHLLDEETLQLLATVPEGMFQFEIGVQSTLDQTLDNIDRHVDQQRLEANVTRLQETGNITLHLDLIAGLPGESYPQLLSSIDRVIDMQPHHLQIELVKLLPGSPLRGAASECGIEFTPHPHYTVLSTPEIDFAQLGLVRALSRVLDMTWNHGRMRGFLTALALQSGSFASGLELLSSTLKRKGMLRHPLSQRGLFEALAGVVAENFHEMTRDRLTEHLARDYALSEKVALSSPPFFFSCDLNDSEQAMAREQLAIELESIRGQGVKLQHFACVFHHLHGEQRSLHLFLYFTRPGVGLEVTEKILA